ncbi:MAG: hypothetical protein OXG92_01320 [Chloroflexi bacterium]|nr:hypothetical protein [Chloroflexota bacterium]MCY3581484.1 hypothetical protein [Chloroflexota bacterium]MCY3715094.1 hypothetical protein [Chloroflexota bacterium]MDE2651168.1 hypothetical protein [Chloroflexota bacterium]MXX49703.1 hypothetical protein [Chloroflexota bacterium]
MQQVTNMVVVGALVGGISGAGIETTVEIVGNIQEQGEINQEVLQDVPQAALVGAKDGAIIGAALAPVGLVIGPVAQVADDVARPAI